MEGTLPLMRLLKKTEYKDSKSVYLWVISIKVEAVDKLTKEITTFKKKKRERKRKHNVLSIMNWEEEHLRQENRSNRKMRKRKLQETEI